MLRETRVCQQMGERTKERKGQAEPGGKVYIYIYGEVRVTGEGWC